MKNKLPFLFISCVILLFVLPIIKGNVPLPADDLVGLYHPYRDFFSDRYPNGIPYKNFLTTDPIRQQFIWKKFAVAQLKQGQIPWWNPYTHSGMPFLANMQAGVFYPLNIVFWALPFIDAWTIFIIMQSILGAGFMYAYLRAQKLHPLASTIGTISFVFGGFFMVWWEWGNIGHTILWLPAILWTIDKYLLTKHPLFLILNSLFLISSFFAGHLQTAFYVLILSIAYLLWKCPRNKLPFFIIPYSLFALFTSIQWLPTFQLINLSARDIDQAQVLTRPDWFIPWQHLAQVIAPDFFGNPATLNYWGTWNYSEFVGYVGLIPLIFALSTFTNKRGKFWWLVLITSLLFALPTPIAKIPFVLKIPLLSQAQPSRLLSIATFALATLSAYGFNQFIHNKSRKLLYIPLLVIALFLLALWLSTFKFIPSEYISITRRNLILPTIILALSSGLFVLSEIKSTFLARLIPNLFWIKISCFLLLLLNSVDALRFATKFTSFSLRDYVFPTTKTIEFLQSDPDIFRIMSLDRRILPPNVSMYYGLQTIEGYDPLYLKSYAQLITQMETGHPQDQPASFNRIISPTNINSDIINKLNVKYLLSLNPVDNPNLKLVLTEGETKVYQNLRVLPRARIVPESNSVTIEQYAPNEIILRIITSTNNVIELADMMYPGWKAYVDSQPTKIIVSPENFRQVTVPAGQHTIKFQL